MAKKEIKTDLKDEEIRDISEEVLDHMMYPRNYGEMAEAQGVGMGADTKTAEFAMVYIHTVDGILNAITFGANACQDTVVAGSLFTEMVKGDTLENAKKASQLMDEKLESAPKKQQACSRLILRAFDAAVINRENRLNNIKEDMHKINVKESCEIEE
ncbi:MAG: iron-sulfur cluster assembly scaffold protein [Arcobacteraceae bacterium]|nr:iron-sulfur cluster assembly scaffold protein [Arcobacteraceae bacterium]